MSLGTVGLVLLAEARELVLANWNLASWGGDTRAEKRRVRAFPLLPRPPDASASNSGADRA